ncbi:MAG: hypothetical protein FJW31_02780 [Acidobacteria bacterium]|nr:hypothetical protein [Acidobacteriota bacterium]
MIVVVGGHSRNIGKTAVMEGILRSLPQSNWHAVKITQHGHGRCSADGTDCGCADAGKHPYALSEAQEPSLNDSGRYLAAGAHRSFWLRTRQGELAEGIPSLRRILALGENTLIESNSVLNFLVPDVYIAVLDFAVDDMKDSARRFLDRADAFVVLHRDRAIPWPGLPARWLASKPVFQAQVPQYAPTALTEWLRTRLQLDGHGKVAAQG